MSSPYNQHYTLGIDTFCPECRKDVFCNLAEVMLRDTLKGEAYEYKGLKQPAQAG